MTGAAFTCVSLESQVQIYTKNGNDLFDIVLSVTP